MVPSFSPTPSGCFSSTAASPVIVFGYCYLTELLAGRPMFKDGTEGSRFRAASLPTTWKVVSFLCVARVTEATYCTSWWMTDRDTSVYDPHCGLSPQANGPSRLDLSTHLLLHFRWFQCCTLCCKNLLCLVLPQVCFFLLWGSNTSTAQMLDMYMVHPALSYFQSCILPAL